MEGKEEKDEKAKGITVVDKRFWVHKDEEEKEETSGKYPTFVEELLSKIEEKENQLNEYISAYRKVKTESEEFQNRLSRDFEKRVEIMKGKIISDLLPLVDNFERALNSADELRDFHGLLDGIKMIYSQVLNILKNDNVEKLERIGRPFDPNIDEAIGIVDVENEDNDNVVVDEFERGYMLSGKLLRPAKVRVGKFANKKEENFEEN